MYSTETINILNAMNQVEEQVNPTFPHTFSTDFGGLQKRV